MSTTYKKISELTKKTSGLVDADYLTGVDTSNSNQNANFTLSALKSYFQTKLESVFAKIASPTLTGTPKAPTAADRNNTTQIATTAFVQKELAFQQTNLPKVDRAGDIMSGDLKIQKTNDTCRFQIESLQTNGNTAASGQLSCNASGDFGIYDTSNSEWVIKSDINGNITLPSLPKQLDDTELIPSKVGWGMTTKTVSQIANYNLVAVRFCIRTANDRPFDALLLFPRLMGNWVQSIAWRGDDNTYIRGRCTIDWSKNEVGVDLINGALETAYCSAQQVYGLF